MIVQSPKRITTQGVSDDSKEAVTSVGAAINTFIEEVYLAITGKITISDNLDQRFQQITVTVDTNGTPKSTIKFKTGLTNKANGIICVRSFGGSFVDSSPFIDYSESSSIIQVNNVKGLTPDVEYTLVLLIIGS